MPKKYILAGFPVEEFGELDSTNNCLKRRAGETEGELAVIALRQTGGRGRLGRSFFSPDGGLYLSVLLRDLPENFHSFITPAAAVAVAEALEECGSGTAGIKWVNDVYIRGKKVCGILCETVSALPGAAIVGIGVNIAEPPGGFPEDIKNRAGAAFAENIPGLRLGLAEKILKNLKIEARRPENLAERYRARSFLIGREVVLSSPGAEPCAAKVLGVDDSFRLIVDAKGEIRKIFMGEVTVKI